MLMSNLLDDQLFQNVLLHEVLLSLHRHHPHSHASGHLQQHRCYLTTDSSACLLSWAHHYHVVYLSMPLNARHYSQRRAQTSCILYFFFTEFTEAVNETTLTA